MVDLSDNAMTDVGSADVCRALQRNECLQYLIIQGEIVVPQARHS